MGGWVQRRTEVVEEKKGRKFGRGTLPIPLYGAHGAVKRQVLLIPACEDVGGKEQLALGGSSTESGGRLATTVPNADKIPLLPLLKREESASVPKRLLLCMLFAAGMTKLWLNNTHGGSISLL